MNSPKTASGNTFLDLALLAVSGVAMWAAFPSLSWWFLTIPSLALLVGIIDRVAPMRAAAYSAFWTMTFMMPLISWMQIATDKTWLAWFALAGAQAFFLALWGLTFAAMGVWSWARTIPGEALGGALLWVTFEVLRSRVPFGGFPWGKVSYPQVDGPLIAYAPLGGEVLVAFIVFVIAVLLRRTFAIAPGPVPGPVLGRFLALGVAALLFFVPIAVKLPTSQQAGSISVGVIQGNVEMPMEETFATPRKVTGNHARQTLEMVEAGEKPDIVFWGENAIDIDPREDPETAALVTEAVDATGVPAVVGFMEYSGDLRYNWLGVWEPGKGLTEELYGKQHPVPWGEYIPLREVTLKLATAAAQISVDMAAVDNPGLIQVQLSDGETLPIAVGICFEVAYEPIISEGVKLGGQLIAIPTNNAHFQDSDESVQQLQMAQFRAAEFSRSALQISTNGVSGVIRPDGALFAVTEVQTADYLVASVPLRTTLTPAAVMGTVPANLVTILGLGLGAFSVGAYVYGRTLWRGAKGATAISPRSGRSANTSSTKKRAPQKKQRR